jgi:hypothetical protein
MCYPKDPTAKIVARLAPDQVTKKRQKDFLSHFFGIISGETKGSDKSYQPISVLIEERYNLAFELRPTLLALSANQQRQRSRMH